MEHKSHIHTIIANDNDMRQHDDAYNQQHVAHLFLCTSQHMIAQYLPPCQDIDDDMLHNQQPDIDIDNGIDITS